MKIPIIGIAAHGSNQGKTRLLTGLLAEFAARNLKVAVLKHAQHVDLMPAKDSSLFMEAGAIGALVVAPKGWQLLAQPPQEPDFSQSLELLEQSCSADLLLIEGYKQGPQAKLLLTQETLGPEQLLPGTVALISEKPQSLNLPCFSSADIVGIADFIIKGV